MSYFTPLNGLSGGAVIGLSAGALLLLSGEILGASGLVSSTILYPQKALSDPSITWKLVFISSFLVFSNSVLGQYFASDPRMEQDEHLMVVSTAGYLLGGALVGFGTRLGNGCTTGHGICGLARMSKRSLVAVIAFMLSALITANLVAPDNSMFSEMTSFLRTNEAPQLENAVLGKTVTMPVVMATMIALYNLRKATESLEEKEEKAVVDNTTTSTTTTTTSAAEEKKEEDTKSTEKPKDEIEVSRKFDSKKRIPGRRERVIIQDATGKLLPAIFAGSLFALGLALSGMVVPSKILGFLNLYLAQQGTWDPTLLMVMGGGSIFSWIAYQFVDGFGVIPNKYSISAPRGSSSFCNIPTNTKIDANLVIGGSVFGIGWGIAGLCPGPAMFLAATGTQPIIQYWWPMFIGGAFVAQKVKEMK
ncbi:unnamed protein product [Cylindrotheca closterium]|uniref:Sulphur transport domain-containing protein n=1 Tax=Cylindrotheca closterium TaxID=2856 RepID=A0AAD2G7P3_9STRA|nr:unnamed protein product [Cylindrotheca closterium]